MGASPASGGLVGGACGVNLPCDGGNIDVGLWEADGASETRPSGLARNSTRISTSNVVTGYRRCPITCVTDADCSAADTVARFCRASIASSQKLCIQDHLSWVAASVGMSGTYGYNTQVPTTESLANAVGTFGATGAWKVDYRVGNDTSPMGLSYLIAPPAPSASCEASNPPPTPYVNRSVSQTLVSIDWAGRAYGTFVTAASGNIGGATVTCAQLKNGLCVGSYDYKTFADLSTHRATATSSLLNDMFFDASLERPHLLGPGNHDSLTSGLHAPSIDPQPPTTQMRHASYQSNGQGGFVGVQGTSFAAPAILSAAIQAHQYEGWLSALAFPMVNKAVLLAATQDANADGAIGKAWVWSANAPTQDALDGAGQIRFDLLKATLDNNRYSGRTSGMRTSCRVERIAARRSSRRSRSHRSPRCGRRWHGRRAC
jgi:Subtilase family